jgi:DNA-binding NtrC family response regulator
MFKESILVVDDDASVRDFLERLFRKNGYEVDTAASGEAALKLAETRSYDVVVTDIKMPGVDGLEVLKHFKEQDPLVQVIMITGYASQETAIKALNMGAFYYILKPVKNDELKQVVKNALEIKRLSSDKAVLERELKTHFPKQIIGRSRAMSAVFRVVEKVAPTDSTILIYGESGTGKELVARAIHDKSNRSDGRFVSINCGALPESLLESELFGHVKGSFTGAVRDKEGLFSVARGGTFFLDEVGETSASIQVKLLRVLQEREIVPVGGTKPIQVNVRLIAATNADLAQLVRSSRFRADLYYRLNVIPIVVPPLRERKEDIPLLVEHFLERYSGGHKTISDEAMEVISTYDWPGNVRELENIIERAVILQEGDVITAEGLNVSVFPEKLRKRHRSLDEAILGSCELTLEELEKNYLLKVLDETGWRKKKAAKVLGINPSTLYRKLKRYEMECVAVSEEDN